MVIEDYIGMNDRGICFERQILDLTDAASAGLPRGALGVMSVRAVPKKTVAPVGV